ncbi:MAG TPA: AgmX/PglI C-terminal domain-containing protein, partial [Agitococcus sp.]|nr:AgmX/PglI C-terminal domain-containing protein [Agitococcus sp.]
TYWRPVWGIAASVVMMSSLVWYWQAQQPQELARAVAVSAPPPQAKPVPQKTFEENAKDENAVMAEDEFGSLHDQVVEEKVTVNKPAEHQLLLQAKSKKESSQTEELRQLAAAAPAISLENRQAEADALVAEPQAEQAKQARVMASPAITDNLSAKREKKAEGLSAKLNQTQDKNINNQRTPEQVRAVFEKNFAQFNLAYQQALKENANLEQGVVRFKLIIDEKGTVASCMVASSTLNNPELEAKFVEIVKKFNFGEATEEWKGTYPVYFDNTQ